MTAKRSLPSLAVGLLSLFRRRLLVKCRLPLSAAIYPDATGPDRSGQRRSSARSVLRSFVSQDRSAWVEHRQLPVTQRKRFDVALHRRYFLGDVGFSANAGVSNHDAVGRQPHLKRLRVLVFPGVPEHVFVGRQLLCPFASRRI